MGADRGARSRLGPLVVVGALLAALVLALRWAQSPPGGPVEPSWSQTPCAHCGMLVGDSAHAAQLHTPAGEVRFFDDAGCLLLYAGERPDERAPRGSTTSANRAGFPKRAPASWPQKARR